MWSAPVVKAGAWSSLHLAGTGLMPLAFMAFHLFQLRFGGTPVFGPCSLRPPLYLINIWGVLSLNPFWTNNTAVVSVGVRRGSYRCPFACGRC